MWRTTLTVFALHHAAGAMRLKPASTAITRVVPLKGAGYVKGKARHRAAQGILKGKAAFFWGEGFIVVPLCNRTGSWQMQSPVRS